MSITIQYVIVGAILLAATIWIILKFSKKGHGKDSGCCGCSLHAGCARKVRGGKNGNDCFSPDKPAD